MCRYNSRRLHGKILREINGKTILQYILERLAVVVDMDSIVVATSREPSDNPVAEYCNMNRIQCFRGELDNVARRFLTCAKQYSFDYATRINGDNLFVDIPTLREMKMLTETGKYDFISNVKNRTFPKGMSIETVRISYYDDCYRAFDREEHYEHVTLWLYQHDEGRNHYYHYNSMCPEAAGIQMAIDTEDDFSLAEKIIGNFAGNHTEYGLKEIFQIRKKNEQSL